MTVIDQSILIPTSPDVIWAIISDIDKNANWQADYQSVSFLTSMRSGTGVRWRYASPGGNDFVVETTAWYDSIGYEYTYIDGAPFRESKGRLRLQEIAEGTIVQWSLEYEMGGVLAGMRNSLSVRRQYEKIMVNSLRGLWTLVKETGGTRQDHEAKSLMRDAPDYEGRARYVARHPSRAQETEKESVQLDEPPVSDEDTRPNPVIAASETEKPERDQGWIEMEPAQIETGSATETDENEKVQAEDHTRFQPPSVESESDDLEILVEPDPEPVSVTAPVDTDDLHEITVLPDHAQGEVESDDLDEEFKPIIDTSKLDTREVSIWEVFGVPSPSETQRLRAIQVNEQDEPIEDQAVADEASTADQSEAVTVQAPHQADEVAAPDIHVVATADTDGILEASEEIEATDAVNTEAAVVSTAANIDIAMETTSENEASDPPDELISATVTRQALPVVQSKIIGYRVNLRRRIVKIRHYR